MPPKKLAAIDWKALRAEFPALSKFTYLDTATFGQVPRIASKAIGKHIFDREQTASAKYLGWFDDMDSIRHSCACLVNCAASDIAFVPSASVGLSYLIHGLQWQPGDEVLTLEGEFPNQLYQSAALANFGARLKTVRWPAFYEALNQKTRLVLLSTVNYATGFRPPLHEISSLLNKRGILLYIDGTQSLGALRFDTQSVQCSMFCVDAYKWMLSPNGAGFVYIRPELRHQLAPTFVGWRSDSGWRSVGSLNHGEPVFADSAEKFEGGMLPFPSLYAMGAVVELMLEVGPHRIEARVLELAAKLRNTLSELGAEVNQDESQIVTARFDRRDTVKLASDLKQDRILVSARHGRLRISPHFYNDETDIETLKNALSQ